MFNRLLVFVLVTVVFARPDVSHLKTVESKSGVTSYDVPISSVDKKYVTTTHNRFIQQDLPTVTYVPQVTYSQHYETSGNVVPTLVSNSATGHYGLLGQHGASSEGVHVVTQQGHGGGEKVVITQFGSQPTHGSGQIVGTHHVTHGQIAGIDQHQQHVQNEERVYFFSAPEELHHKTRVRINVVPTHTRKSNVIFVNAPSIPEIIPEVIVPPQQFVEDKTKVVVLVKEHDQFVPISVPAPVPVNKGKTEVFVVKYNDKNDAERILSGTGKFYESSLIQQDKPGFLSTLNANVIKHQAISNVAPSILQSHSDGVSFGTLQHGSHIGKTSIGSNVESSGNVYGLSDGGLGSSNSYGTQFVKVVDTTPKVESYVVKNVESGSGGGSGNIKAVNYEFNTANVVSSTPTVDLYEIKNPGGKQLSTYEVKTVETVKSTPTVVSYGIQNLGGNVQGNTESKTYEYRTVGDSNPSGLNVRYSGDVDGSNQSGYTIQSTEFVHNSPSSEFVSHDNIEGIKRALGKSGGFDIVSISKGTLDGSASLGVNTESLNFGSNVVAQDDNSFVRSVEISESATPSSALLQSKVFGSTQQSQIQKDAAKVVSSSTLSP
ncbi:hypothetical protein RN001_010033 [Aquatica leii]|uniref:DUF243 domain-containing protein n=1 Tax=Aquatica leii TaxID=1421715 RepID=A0AAN7P604_9COLE|nr:hypothetical protein RN001_010033 [Aquatica leii]